MADCIDLKEHFGDRYQVEYEESYEAERGEGGRLHDPWLVTIPCKNGHLYPQGGQFLAAATNHRGPIANKLAALDCVRVVQDGDDGVNAVFHADDFDQVAAVMRPMRKRRLTDDQRVEQAERLRPYRFRAATHDAGSERRRDPATVAEFQAILMA